MTWRGVFTGALALIALQTALNTDDATDRVGNVGDLLGWIAEIVTRVFDPTVAAIPDLRATTSTTSN